MASGEGPEKAKSKSVSLLPRLWEQVEAKAEASYRGNRSDYFRELAERDLNGVPQSHEALAPSVLVDLAKSLCGPLVAKELELKLAGLDQSRELARFIYARLSPHWKYTEEVIGDMPALLVDDDEGTRYFDARPEDRRHLVEAGLSLMQRVAAKIDRGEKLGPYERAVAEQAAEFGRRVDQPASAPSPPAHPQAS
jgi:hypothetical protein